MKIKLFQRNNGCFYHISVKDFKGGVSEGYKVKGLKEGDKLIGVIDYPLGEGEEVKIEFTWKENRFDLCRQICEVYQRLIYKNEDEFKVWGHGIGDLVIEQITVDTDSKTIEISVGS